MHDIKHQRWLSYSTGNANWRDVERTEEHTQLDPLYDLSLKIRDGITLHFELLLQCVNRLARTTYPK